MQSGLHGMFYGCSITQIRDLTDGTSNTLMVGETFTDVSFVKDGQGMDYWAFGTPATSVGIVGKATEAVRNTVKVWGRRRTDQQSLKSDDEWSTDGIVFWQLPHRWRRSCRRILVSGGL